MAGESSEHTGLHYKRISSKIIPGILDNHNKGAVDWGWQDLIAYGCQSVVIIVDPSSVQIVQTLDGHNANVTKVKWASGNYSDIHLYPHMVKLASADTSGNIIIWNVRTSTSVCHLSDGSKQVLDMQWLNVNMMDGAHELLAALHPPYSFIIWNTRTGTKLWKKTYTESLLSFTFDPFCSSNVAFLCKDSLLLVEDFTLHKVPSSNGRKLYVSSLSALGSSNSNLSSSNESSSPYPTDDKTRNKDKIRKRVRLLGGVDFRSTKSDELTNSSDVLVLMYHPASRHHLLLVYTREVLVLDLEINQTIGVIMIEKSGSPFSQVIPFHHRDVICCLHENGIISLHVRQKPTITNSDSSGDIWSDLHYEIKAASDPIRLTKSHRFYGMAVCPQTETTAAVVVSDGRTLIFQLIPRNQKVPEQVSTLSDYLPPNYGLKKHELAMGRLFRFILVGVLHNASAPPLVIRMCPPLTTKNWHIYQPWMAAGATTGVIQVFDMAAGMLHKELSVHTYPVRGIEWVGLSSIISYAHQNVSNSLGHVKNELYFTDILTGKLKGFRCDNQEESPIDMIRVSSLKQYFIIALKEDPLELWDVKTLSLLRVMSRQFPVITALEWFPTIGSGGKKRQSVISSNSLSLSVTPSSLISSSIAGIKDTSSYLSTASSREVFVFVDADGRLYQFIVEGNTVKDGRQLAPQNGFGSITAMSWKSNYLVMGDVDGSLIVMDLRTKTFKSISTSRGWIKKVRFAPGKGNMKILILYNDGVDIWEVLEGVVLNQLKTPRDISRIDDCDWAASDKPVIVTGDGCLRVMDLNLKGTSSSIEERECFAPFWCPSLQPTYGSIKTYMMHSKAKSDHLFDKNVNENFVSDQLTVFKSRLNDLIGIFDDIGANNCPFSMIHHYMTVARFLGDETEYKFWQIALHYLRLEVVEKSTDSAITTCDWCQTVFLDGNFDLICDTDTYKKMQRDRLDLHESKLTSHELSQKRAETLILLQETDRAVRQLLETDSTVETFYSDCLRACLVASAGLSQSTIKLVATSLIASGRLLEGVQLLCLINKGIDACRYLQSYGKWEKAMWLAKCTLSSIECLEVARRWADHLISPQVDQKAKGVHLMLSFRQFSKVLEMLFHFNYVERAAVFAEICDDLQLLSDDEFTKQLLKDVYLKYGRHLKTEGNNGLAKHYANKAGADAEFT
ncbi:WD repeat-containing protein 11 [Chamberlinius hualienensis]